VADRPLDGALAVPTLWPMTTRIQIAKARKNLTKVLARSAAGARIKVTRYGTTLAGLISKADLQKLEDCEKKEPVVSGGHR
jgi:prevent-host-death family protein